MMRKIVVRKGAISTASTPGTIKADSSQQQLSTSGPLSSLSAISEVGSTEVDYLPTEVSNTLVTGLYAEDQSSVSETFSADNTLSLQELTQINEQLSLRLDSGLSDPQSVSESIAVFIDAKLPGEVSMTTEVFSMAFEKLLEDLGSVSEVISLSIDSGVAETLGLLETVFIVVEKSLDDSSSVSESVSLSASSVLSGETATIVENLELTLVALLAAELANTTDVVSLDSSKGVDDSNTSSDEISLTASPVLDDTSTSSDTLSLSMDAKLLDSPTVSELLETLITISLTDTITVSEGLVGQVVVVYQPSDESLAINESVSIALSPYVEDTSLVSEEVSTAIEKVTNDTSSVGDLGIIVKQSYFLSEYTVGHRYTGTVTNF